MSPVKLKDVADAIDVQTDESVSYLNIRTGAIVVVTDEDREALERSEESRLPDWQREALPAMREALESKDFVELPSKFDLDEYRVMETFVRQLPDEPVRDRLFRAIKGRGAFGRFKDTAASLNLIDQWYRFRDASIRAFARAWLEHQGIAFEDLD